MAGALGGAACSVDTIAVCLDGVEDDELVAVAVRWLDRFARVEVWCACGDVAARELIHLRDRHGRAPPPSASDPIDREQAAAIAEHGVALVRVAARIEAHPRVLCGRDPGHALAASSEPRIALLVAAGHRGGIGPKSVGHVARFVIGHARGPVIVVRTA